MLSHMCPTAVEIWNEEMNGVLPAVVSLGDVRKKKLIKLLKEIGCEKKGVDEFRKFCQIIKRSDFLTGKKTDWKANFDFCIKPANFLKIVEGNYDD